MKSRSLVLVGIGALAAGSSAWAAPIAQLDSGSFSSTLTQIEGDAAIGTLATWSENSGPLDGATTVNGDGTITIAIPEDGDHRYINSGAGGSALDASVGWTWETRIRIDSETNADSPVFDMTGRDDRGAGAATWIQFYTDGLGNRPAGQSGAQFVADMTSFHVVRMAFDASDNSISLWLDGALLSDALAHEGFVNASTAFIGNTASPNDGGGVTIDYIRYDTTGAYAPIPEPGSLALIGLGGLALLRRRRA